MENLTPRQIEILNLVITEHTKTGEPVGSDLIDKKYNLGVSPATIRNEMMELAKKGYLKKHHFSSGRIPTVVGYRFYIKNILKEKDLTTNEEVSCKNDIWDYRTDLSRLLQEAVSVLAKRTKLLALTTTNSGLVHYFGVNNILLQKEFFDIEFSRNFFEQLDEVSFWKDILNGFKETESKILFLLGEENLKHKGLEHCASIFGEFEGAKVKGVIGVTGSQRMNYETVIPSIKYFTNLIEQIIKEQGL